MNTSLAGTGEFRFRRLSASKQLLIEDRIRQVHPA
jgi:hypothetical protein